MEHLILYFIVSNCYKIKKKITNFYSSFEILAYFASGKKKNILMLLRQFTAHLFRNFEIHCSIIIANKRFVFLFIPNDFN